MLLATSENVLLDNLKQAYQKLDSELDSIDSSLERLAQIDRDISCCDVLAYQIGWSRLLLGWDQQEANGAIPPMPAEGFKWSQQKELALSFYQGNSDKSLARLRKESGNEPKKPDRAWHGYDE